MESAVEEGIKDANTAVRCVHFQRVRQWEGEERGKEEDKNTDDCGNLGAPVKTPLVSKEKLTLGL